MSDPAQPAAPAAASTGAAALLPTPSVLKRFYTEFRTRLTKLQGLHHPAHRETSASVHTVVAASSATGLSRRGETPSRGGRGETSRSDKIDEDADNEDAALRRLTPAQAEATASVLWQWMWLLYAETRTSDDREGAEAAGTTASSNGQMRDNGEDADGRDGLAVAHATVHTPAQVEQLFHTGWAALIPATVGTGSAAVTSRNRAPGLSRTPTADSVYPWHRATFFDHVRAPSPCLFNTASYASLVAALSKLSAYGPLFGSTYALWYCCLVADLAKTEPLSEGTVHGDKEGATTKNEERLGVDVHARVQRVYEAWMRVATSFKRASDNAVGSMEVGKETVEMDRLVSQKDVVQLWYEVYAVLADAPSRPCHESRLSDAQAASTCPGSDSPPPLSSLSPTAAWPRPPSHLPLTAFASQWYIEGCRVASRGRDDGFQVEAVPLTCLNRVMRYMCRRLREEVETEARRAADPSMANGVASSWPSVSSPPPPPAGSRNVDETADEPEKQKTRVSQHRHRIRLPAPLRIATLTGMALQTPSTATTASDHPTAVASASKRNRPNAKPARPRRRRRRATWQDSDSSEAESEEEDEEGLAAYDSAYLPEDESARVGVATRAAFRRFLRETQQPYGAPIASAVLTAFTLTSRDTVDGLYDAILRRHEGVASAVGDVPQRTHDAARMQATQSSTSYAVQLTREMYLRNGEVQWWMLGDSQRHRSLMANRRA